MHQGAGFEGANTLKYIKWGVFCGESASVNPGVISNWCESILSCLQHGYRRTFFWNKRLLDKYYFENQQQ